MSEINELLSQYDHYKVHPRTFNDTVMVKLNTSPVDEQTLVLILDLWRRHREIHPLPRLYPLFASKFFGQPWFTSKHYIEIIGYLRYHYDTWDAKLDTKHFDEEMLFNFSKQLCNIGIAKG